MPYASPKKRFSRRASCRYSASPWLMVQPRPAMPVSEQQSVPVYDGWLCPSVADVAIGLLQVEPEMTLRELQDRILQLFEHGRVAYPYIWWLEVRIWRKRNLHIDAVERSFVKLAHRWQMAYPVQILAGLVGAQGTYGDFERVPPHSYFVVYENEDLARLHCFH